MRDKVLMFYNPYSGNGVFKNNLDHIIERFQAEGYTIVPIRANRGNDLERFLKTMDQSMFRQIIIAGGDGTINICVNLMIQYDIDLPIAIFPTGTANDFASYLNLPVDVDGMIDVALSDITVPADVGMVNGKCFVNVMALGNMIDVSQKTDPNLKNTLGRFAYYLTAAGEISGLHPIPVKLTSHDDIYEEEMLFMIVMNGESAGGFRTVSPQSDINDGKLNVILFRKRNILELVPLGIKMLQGDHLNDPKVLTFKTDDLLIESPEDIPTDVDGEHGVSMPLKFSVLHNKLRIHVTASEREYYETHDHS